MTTTTINTPDGPFTFAGNSTDGYFQNLQGFTSASADLIEFVRYLKPDGIILDVGANIGITALLMAQAAPECEVVAFEPSPENAAFFRENLSAEQRVRLVASGVAEEAGELRFLVHAGANCHAVSEDYLFAETGSFTSVPVVTLDDEFPTGDVSFIKIDVEGFEPHVLAGARNLIARCRPWLWMEFNSVALNVAHGYSPMAFATGLFKTFEVFYWEDGALVPVAGPDALVHDNMVKRQSVQDVVLKPIPGAVMPTVAEFIAPASWRRR